MMPFVRRQLLADVQMCSFVAGLLSSGDSPTALAALPLAHALMSKLPATFHAGFLKVPLLPVNLTLRHATLVSMQALGLSPVDGSTVWC